MSLDKGQPFRDAFGRTRSSTPQTLFDSKQIFDQLPLFFDDQEVSGSGTNSVYSQDRASTTLSVDAGAAGKRVRQTFRRFNYQPGKAQQVFLTFVMGAAATSVRKRVGYFDDENGLFFEQTDEGLFLVRRSNVTGTPVDERVAQEDWNLDRLDDSQVDGPTLDITKIQLMLIDYAWLGAQRARVGFHFNGDLVYAHEFTHSNELDSVFMSVPNLPLRQSIESFGAGSGTAEYEGICASIIAEGGQETTGITTYVSNGALEVDANTVGVIYGVLGLRLKSTHLQANILPASISYLAGTTDDYEWIVAFNPSLATTASWSDVDGSAMQFAEGDADHVVTGGEAIAGGYQVSGGGTGSFTTRVETALQLGAAIDGTRDEIWLCVRPLSAGLDILCGVTLRELL